MHIYLIAGEQSGDLLGARLMHALKARAGAGNPLSFSGIGGHAMAEEGLKSRIALSELAVMGFVEVLPHAPRLLKRIKETAEDIIATQPDVVITIDAPGFCFRVAKACRKHWPKGTKSAPRFIHYVAPSVWAYKPGRAKKVAALYDHVLTLLPFEPPYFDDAGMEATFVGHPLVETAEDIAPDGIMFRTRHAIPGDAPLVAALPGSRLGEVKRHLPLLREATALLIQQEPKLVMTMPVVPHLTAAVREMTQNWPCKLVVVNESTEKWNAFDAANIALAKSGTVTLELALFNTPMVVFYKVNPVSAWLIKQMLRVPYVSLINILADAHVVPELLQDDATPEALSEAALLLLHSSNAQTKACEEGLRKLGLGDAKTPSEKAAEVVLSAT